MYPNLPCFADFDCQGCPHNHYLLLSTYSDVQLATVLADEELLSNPHVHAYVKACYSRWAKAYAGDSLYQLPGGADGRSAMPANLMGWALASLEHVLRGGGLGSYRLVASGSAVSVCGRSMPKSHRWS